MKPGLAREVVQCLPTGRTLFRYSKDDYAFHLLRMLGARERSIHKLRQTDLPKRFCFDETDEVPQLLSGERNWSRREKAAREPVRFFKMAV